MARPIPVERPETFTTAVVELDEDGNMVGMNAVIDLWKAPVAPMFRNQALGFGRSHWSGMVSLFLKRTRNWRVDRQLSDVSWDAKGHWAKGLSVDATGTGTPSEM